MENLCRPQPAIFPKPNMYEKANYYIKIANATSYLYSLKIEKRSRSYVVRIVGQNKGILEHFVIVGGDL